MSKIDYQALREAAERAIPAMERLLMLPADDDLLSEQELKDYGVDIDALNAFKFLAGPETVLALLDERERNQQYIKSRDQENEDIALTVGKLRVELEGKDSKIANLTAERDALREGEMGDARHSNTRAAADIYFQLVEECEIPAGGSLVEYVDDMREKLEAAEKRIAELESLMEPKLPQPAVVDNDKFRADFERWMVEDEKCIVGSSDPYPAGIESRNWRAWNACRAAMLQSQDSGIKDGWISCSERMPVIGELNWRTSFPLLVTCEIGVIPAYYGFVSVNGDRHYGFMESLKYGDANGNHPQTNEYGLISNVTHWMSLPERRRSRTVNNAELFQKISALATECHAIASELDVGDERTEMFEIYSVLRNLCRRGYATQVGRMTNPLLSSCDEDDSDEDDE